MSKQAGRLTSLANRFRADPYPFEHATAGITIANFLLPDLPDRSNPNEVMGASSHTLSSLYDLHNKTLTRLAALTASDT